MRQPSYRVTLNRLVADDFCCYVMSLRHHAAAGVFFVLKEKRRKAAHRVESNTCSTPIAVSCLWVRRDPRRSYRWRHLCPLWSRAPSDRRLPRRAHHLLLPFFALIGSAIVFAYRTWGKGTDRGMSLVFDVGHGREDAIRKARPVLSRRLGYAKCSNVIPRTRPQAEAATPCGRGRRHIR